MPNVQMATKMGVQHQKLYSTTCSAPLAGETLTITCYTCGMPSSTEWAQRASIRPSPTALTKPYFPFLSSLTPPHGATPISPEDGSTFLCAFCHASLQAQWNNYEKSPNPLTPKERQYNSHNFTCAVCSVETYRKRVRALPFQEFPFLVKERQPGSITLGDNPLAVVCLDCSETLWAQSAEYDRWGLPIQKRHFNWMARPPPPEDSMEATVARLPSGETQLPRCSPIIRPRVMITPRNPGLQIQTQTPPQISNSGKVKLPKPNSSSSSNYNKGSDRRDSIGKSESVSSGYSSGNRKFSAPVLTIPSGISSPENSNSNQSHPHQHSTPPVVTVAPMSSHHNSGASIRKGTSSVPPNLISAPGSSRLYPQHGSVNLRHPLYPTPTYSSPYAPAWSLPPSARREIDEHTASAGAAYSYPPPVERNNTIWNWLTPQPQQDLLRYQSYLSSLDNRNFSAPDALFNGLQAQQAYGNSQSGSFLPPTTGFLPSEFGHKGTNSPPRVYSTAQQEVYDSEKYAAREIEGSKIHRQYRHSISITTGVGQGRTDGNGSSSPEIISIINKNLKPKEYRNGENLMKEGQVPEKTMKKEETKLEMEPKNEKIQQQSSSTNRKILPKKRKYHFESEVEPMEYTCSNSDRESTSETERERKDSNSYSETEINGSTSLPVDLSKNLSQDIPPNFKIAYLCSQKTNSSAGSSGSCSPERQPQQIQKEPRNSVIVSMSQKNENSDETKIKIEPAAAAISTPVYDSEISVYKSKSPAAAADVEEESKSKSENSTTAKLEDNENVAVADSDESQKQMETDCIISPKSDENGNILANANSNSNAKPNTPNGNKKSEAEMEAFVNEALEVFKQQERIRIILREKETRRKLEFLNTLDLVTLQDKSEIELRKLISRFERNTLPPLKLRPESPAKENELGGEFQKQIVLAALEDPTLKKPTVADVKQLSFLNNLKLKPASRAEKARREREWRLFLLERKMREKRAMKACGIRRPWDHAVNISKLRLDGKSSFGRRNQSLNANAFRKLSLQVPPHSVHHQCNNYPSSDLLLTTAVEYNQNQGQYANGYPYGQRKGSTSSLESITTTRSSPVRSSEPIINYPKYIPSYSSGGIVESGGEDCMMGARGHVGASVLKLHDGTGEKQQNKEDRMSHNGVFNNKLRTFSFSSSESGGTTEVGLRQSICIPKIPVFDSIASKKRLEFEGIILESSESPKINQGEEDEEITGPVFCFPTPIPKQMGVGTEVTVKDKGGCNKNGSNSNPLPVDPIIQGYRDCWLKTKRNIEEMVITGKPLKPDVKSQKLAVCEMRRLRKTLITQQSEMKILERKLRRREKEIENQVVVIGNGNPLPQATSARLNG